MVSFRTFVLVIVTIHAVSAPGLMGRIFGRNHKVAPDVPDRSSSDITPLSPAPGDPDVFALQLFNDLVVTWFQGTPTSGSEYEEKFASLTADTKKAVIRSLYTLVDKRIVSGMRGVNEKPAGIIRRVAEKVIPGMRPLHAFQKRLKQEDHVDSGKVTELDGKGRVYTLKSLIANTDNSLIFTAIRPGSDQEYIIKYQTVSTRDMKPNEAKFFDTNFVNEFIMCALASLIPGFHLAPRPVYISPRVTMSEKYASSMPKLSHASCSGRECTVEYMILERVGMSLGEYVQSPISTNRADERLDPLVTAELLQDGFRLLVRLHELGIVHGDIHLGNICFGQQDRFVSLRKRDHPYLVLIDFGLAHFADEFSTNPSNLVAPNIGTYFEYSEMILKLRGIHGKTLSRKGRVGDILRLLEGVAGIYTGTRLSQFPQRRKDEAMVDYEDRIIGYKKPGEYFVDVPGAPLIANRLNGVIKSLIDDSDKEIPYSSTRALLQTIVNEMVSEYGESLVVARSVLERVTGIMDRTERTKMLTDEITKLDDISGMIHFLLDRLVLSMVRTKFSSIIEPHTSGGFLKMMKANIIRFQNTKISLDSEGGSSRCVSNTRTICITSGRKFRVQIGISMNIDRPRVAREYALGVIGSNEFLAISPTHVPIVLEDPVYMSEFYSLTPKEVGKLEDKFSHKFEQVHADWQILEDQEDKGKSRSVFAWYIVYLRNNEEYQPWSGSFRQGLELLQRTAWLGINLHPSVIAADNIFVKNDVSYFASLGEPTYDPQAINARAQIDQLIAISEPIPESVEKLKSQVAGTEELFDLYLAEI
jgi:serine/threonine protein kinase